MTYIDIWGPIGFAVYCLTYGQRITQKEARGHTGRKVVIEIKIDLEYVHLHEEVEPGDIIPNIFIYKLSA